MPLTPYQLRQIGVFSWDDISEDFLESDLLLGNGFSLHLHEIFRYESLFERFLANCTADEVEIFSRFDTSNFERILESLVNASKVNAIFGIPDEPINVATERLKEGLITTVGLNHPRATDLNRRHLTQISEAFDHFRDVFALSYDALLYQIIMISLDRHRLNNTIRPYNDFFWFPYNDQFLQFMNYQNIPMYKHIYYLHGALFIFRLGATTVKIRRTDDSELLERIQQQIREGNMPLFVSEGTSEDKQFAISRSEYLQFANARLRHRTNRLVVYGASLSGSDSHIVQELRNPERQIAISIRVGEKSEDDLRAEMEEQSRKFPGQPFFFFDSSTLFTID